LPNLYRKLSLIKNEGILKKREFIQISKIFT